MNNFKVSNCYIDNEYKFNSNVNKGIDFLDIEDKILTQDKQFNDTYKVLGQYILNIFAEHMLNKISYKSPNYYIINKNNIESYILELDIQKCCISTIKDNKLIVNMICPTIELVLDSPIYNANSS